MIRIHDRTTYVDGSVAARNPTRGDLARQIRSIRRDLDLVIFREAPGRYVVTNVSGPMKFERVIEIARREQS